MPTAPYPLADPWQRRFPLRELHPFVERFQPSEPKMDVTPQPHIWAVYAGLHGKRHTQHPVCPFPWALRLLDPARLDPVTSQVLITHR
jgi:hypothetical protein